MSPETVTKLSLLCHSLSMVRKTHIEHNGKVYVSQEQFAKHRGVSRRTIYRYIKEGKIEKAIHRIGKNNQPFINIEIAEIEMGEMDPGARLSSETQKQTAPGVQPKDENGDPEFEHVPPASSSYQVHRANREAYSSKLEKIKYEEKAGLLVSRKQVELEAVTLARLVRDSILNVPSRIAAQIAAESNRVKCELIIEKELRLALEELANTNMEVINVNSEDNSGELRETPSEDSPSGT